MSPGKPFKKGHPKFGGRRPGSLNVFNKTVKESFQNVYQQLGGDAWLLKVAKRHGLEFAKLYSKMLPSKVEAIQEKQEVLRQRMGELSEDQLRSVALNGRMPSEPKGEA